MSDLSIESEKGVNLFGENVSDLQFDVLVYGNEITGTLKYVTMGLSSQEIIWH